MPRERKPLGPLFRPLTPAPPRSPGAWTVIRVFRAGSALAEGASAGILLATCVLIWALASGWL